MNTEEKTTTKRTGTKVLACLLAVLLMEKFLASNSTQHTYNYTK